MAFDPSTFGATPAASTGFDPSKFGATAVASQPAPTQIDPITSLPKNAPTLADNIWSGLSGARQAITGAGQEVNAAISGTGQYAGQGAVERGFSAASSAAAAIPKVAASVIPGATTALNAVGGAQDSLTSFLGKIIGNTKAVQDFVTKHPEAANDLQTAASIGQSSGNIAGTILGAQGVASAGDAAVNAVKTASQTAKGAEAAASTIKPQAPLADSEITGKPTPEVSKIQDTISPKMNAKEVRLALDQGRIIPGQDPTLLRGGTPDTVLPSDRTVRAAQTISKQIPGSSEMSAPELYKALDSKIGSISNDLKPEMQAVPITDEVVSKITNAWQALKEGQLADPYASSAANIEKLQAQFESKFLDPIMGKRFDTNMSQSLGADVPVPTMDDLWETAKAYDQSVPENVRAANSLSPDTLQTQKSIWLQNRAVLRDAITDVSTGLGKTSQNAFSSMSDLYNAQKGIQSSFKLNKGGAPSALSKAYNSTPGKVIRTGIKVGAGLEGVRGVITGHL